MTLLDVLVSGYPSALTEKKTFLARSMAFFFLIPNFSVENYINQEFGPNLSMIFTDQEYGQSVF